jgi:hypothetical protein
MRMNLMWAPRLAPKFRRLRFRLPMLCVFASTAIAQTAPDLQKVLERLDRLEQQNQQLMSEIRELRKQLADAKPAAAESFRAESAQPESPQAEAPRAPSVAERMDIQEARTAELAQTKVDTSQRMPVSLTGMLLFNAFANGKYGGGAQYPVTPSTTASAASTGATFRQTVLGLKFNGPALPGGGKASGSFYMDFWGGTSSAGNNLFRIRLATVDLTWHNTTVTVGQDKPIVAPRDPTSLAQVGLAPLAGAGNLWNWQPQARIEQRFSFGEDFGLRAQAGVYQTAEVYPAGGPTSLAGTLERARPAWQGRLVFYKGAERRRFEIAPGFSASQSHVAGTSAASRLGSVDWLVRPTGFFEFSGAFFAGQNAAGLGALRQPFTVVTTGTVLPVHVAAGWGQIALFPTSRLSFHLFGGEEYDHGRSIPANSIARNLSYAGNLMYKLAPNVIAAFEIAQARTTYLTTGTEKNNHYDVAIAYLF